jgi:hypothetical protein
MFPEQEGQLRGDPVRSLAIRCSACAGLYVAGRGLRIESSKLETDRSTRLRGWMMQN